MANLEVEGQKSNPINEKPRDRNDTIVVGIGASAGGIKALKEFFAKMPSDSGMAFVVILHLSQSHESNLAPILQTQTKMVVRQVEETLKVEPNNVYVIPPGKHLHMSDSCISLIEPERIKGKRVPIDIFFRNLGENYGKNAVAIVLSGTGADGSSGLKRVKEFGGVTIAQEPTEAEYDAMPLSAIGTGLVDLVLNVEAMPGKLLKLKNSPTDFIIPNLEINTDFQELKGDALHKILTLMRIRTGHDFANYKQATLLRRITRRLQVNEVEGLEQYLDILTEKPDEIKALLRDFLISVTNFFRDAEAFEALERNVIPQIFEGKSSKDEVRAWVVSCATGEEAYSIAILMQEYVEKHIDSPKIQIFASDIDESAILTAREGRYDESITADVSPERLKRFFIKEGNSYRLRKEIRELVLFTSHNVLRDPPFSRLNLISCRNLLIYLNRETQQKVLELFNFALIPKSYLFLGSSESAENSTQLFSTFDKKQRIYTSKLRIIAGTSLTNFPTTGRWQIELPDTIKATPLQSLRLSEIHLNLIEQFSPPSILINDEQEIVHISDNAGSYLQFSGGEPTRNLMKAINPSLRLDLRATIFTAKQENKQAETRNVRLKIDGEEEAVDIIVRPIDAPQAVSGYFLVILKKAENKTLELKDTENKSNLIASENVVLFFEEELQLTKDRLRATIEQYETSIEELKASNEELQAINEELRSTTEELETSKEESQSVNEELITVNNELKDKVDEVSRANSDLQNLITSTDIGTMFLDRKLSIKRFTPTITNIFNVIPSDIGRPFEHLTHKLDYKNIAKDINQVLKTLQTVEREVYQYDNDRWYLLRIAPYQAVEFQIDGIVLTFVDVTQRRRAETENHESQQRFKVIVNQATTGITQTDLKSNFTFVNNRFSEIVGWSRDELIGKKETSITFVEDSQEDQKLFEQMFETGKPYTNEKRYTRKDDSFVWVTNSVSPIYDSQKKAIAALIVTLDISESKKAEASLRDQRERMRLAMEAADLYMWEVDLKAKTVKWSENSASILGFNSLPENLESVLELIHPDDRDTVLKSLEQADLGNKGFSIEFRFINSANETVWVQKQGATLETDENSLVRQIGIAQNITARRQAEDKLKDVDKRKDEFLAILAHELRNPLAPIRTALEILRNDSEKGQREQARTVIERQIGQLVNLVDDLLDVSRINNGKVKLKIQQIDLSKAINAAIESNSPFIKAGGQKLKFDSPKKPIFVDADSMRLTQIFLNILNNAAKYTERNGKITITSEIENDKAVVRIKDNGVGIAPEKLKLIFDMFAQIENDDKRSQSGLGIGLSLVKQLVEMHAGTVEARSEGVNKGSEFIIRLPLSSQQNEIIPEPVEDIRETPKVKSGTKVKKKILIVDDNVDAAEMLTMMFSLEGYETRVAFDGLTAVKSALEFLPEVVLLDIGLPDIDGYETARRIRAQQSDVTLIALSGWGQDEDLRKSKEAGFNHHLVKPVQIETITNLIVNT